MLYAMITRRHPFDAPTDYETLMLVKNGDFLPPETARPGLNPELYRVIRKAMGEDRRTTATRRPRRCWSTSSRSCASRSVPSGRPSCSAGWRI